MGTILMIILIIQIFFVIRGYYTDKFQKELQEAGTLSALIFAAFFYAYMPFMSIIACLGLLDYFGLLWPLTVLSFISWLIFYVIYLICSFCGYSLLD